MNTGNIVSLSAKPGVDILPFELVTMTATGVDKCGALDRALGQALPGDLNREYPAVQLFGSQIEAIMGNDTDIAAGDELEQAAAGRFVKKTTGTGVAMALSAGEDTGDRVDAIFFYASAPEAPAT